YPCTLTPRSLWLPKFPLTFRFLVWFPEPSGSARSLTAAGPPTAPPVTCAPSDPSPRRAPRYRLLLDAAAGRHLADPDDDEFRGLHRRETDFDDQLAGVDDLGRIGLVVTLDVERLLQGRAHEGAVPPQQRQERRDGPLDALPQPMVVGLEHH